MVLPNTTDFRAIPERSVHRFVLRELCDSIRTAAEASIWKQRQIQFRKSTHEARKGNAPPSPSSIEGGKTLSQTQANKVAGVCKIGLGVIVVAGEADLSEWGLGGDNTARSNGLDGRGRAITSEDGEDPMLASMSMMGGLPDASWMNNDTPQAGSVAKKQGRGYVRRGERRRRKQEAAVHSRGLQRLGQFICRGLPEAIKRLGEKHIGVVLVDNGQDRALNNLISNSLVGAWGFENVRTLGVLESASGQPDFTRVDMRHSHFISLKRRQTSSRESSSRPYGCGRRRWRQRATAPR